MKKKLVATAITISLASLSGMPALAQSNNKAQEFANEPKANDFQAPSSYDPKMSTTKPVKPASTVGPEAPIVDPPIIVLDPGHGGNDPGAVGNGLTEKELTLNIANYEKSYFSARWPATIYMTRTDNTTTVSLDQRVNFANSKSANIFVSNHINSSTNTSANGVETYWQKADTSQSLATDIQSKLTASGLYNRGVKQNNYYVITYTNMPSALAETGFISNSGDASQLSQSSFQQTLGGELAEGIHLYWWGF